MRPPGDEEMTDWTYREWACEETFVLIGHSYGGFVALDYAVNYPDRLRGLILINTWASGTLGAMTALSYVLTSQRSKVDRARQVRSWSGTTLSDQDCKEAIREMLPMDAPPEEGSDAVPSSTGDHQSSSTSAEFWGPRSNFRSVTHNWAFGQNLPRYDVRQRLHLIKMSIHPPLRALACLTRCRLPHSSPSAVTIMSPRRALPKRLPPVSSTRGWRFWRIWRTAHTPTNLKSSIRFCWIS